MLNRDKLREGLASGRLLVMGDGSLPTWRPGHGKAVPAKLMVHGEAIREALLEGIAKGPVDPRGLRLRGAVISGVLDLTHVHLPYPIEFENCVFADHLGLTSANLAALVLDGSALTGSSPPSERIHLPDRSGYSLSGAELQVQGELSMVNTSTGPIRLVGARVGGQFALRGASVLSSDSNGNGLAADGIQVESDVLLDEEFTTNGALRLLGARISGQLNLRGARLNGSDKDGDSLIADAIRVESSVFVSGLRAEGRVRLHRGYIGGNLWAKASVLRAGLTGPGLRVVGDVHVGADSDPAEFGTLDLKSVHVGSLDATDLVVNGAFDCQELEVDRDFFVRKAIISQGLTLDRAQIRGTADLSGSTLSGDPALSARDLRVDILNLQDSVSIVGAADLSGAVVESRLALPRATEPKPDGHIGSIDLTAAQVGVLDTPIDPGQLPRLVAVVGWRLGDVTGSIRENRRVAETWLEGQPLSQHSVRQPWHELAAVYDRNGQTAEAKRMRYRAEVNATATSSVTTRVWRGVERWVTGHGYYPLRTVGALVGVFLVALLLTGVCRDAFVTPVTRAMEPQIQALKDAQARDLASGTALPPGEPRIDPSLHGTARADVCELRLQHWDTRCFSPWWQAATIAIPVATGATNWEPQPLWLAASIAALRAAAWFLTALLVAGFTGLLRRQA